MSAGAKASILASSPDQNVEIDIGQAKARGWATPVGAGVDASLNAVDVKLGPLDATVGLSASTGVGINDDSLKVELLGTGISLGRRIGVSIFGFSVGIDFGRLF